MRLLSLFLITLVSISGCTTGSKTYMPDGRVGYSINCSGTAFSWGNCFEKAGEICGSLGYDILSQAGEQGSVASANQSGFYGGSVMTRSLLIACKS
jgi:hypothetical protein